MEAVIKNFRMARHHKSDSHMVIVIKGVSDRESAAKLLGKQVIWKSDGKTAKEIKGVVKSVHGNKGAVRAIFEKGMPGQAIGSKVSIQ